MNIKVTYTGGTPNPEIINNATTLRTTAVGAVFTKEGTTRQIQSIEATPANSTERFTLEIRPGSGITEVGATLVSGAASISDINETIGGTPIVGKSVLHATNSTDNDVKTNVEAPPALQLAKAAGGGSSNVLAGGPTVIVVKVKVKHP